MNCDNQFVCSCYLKGKLSIRQEPTTAGDNQKHANESSTERKQSTLSRIQQFRY